MHHELKSNLGAPERAAKAGGLLPVLIKCDFVENGTYVHISEARDLAEHQAVGIFAAKTLSAGTRMTKTTTTGGSYAKQT